MCVLLLTNIAWWWCFLATLIGWCYCSCFLDDLMMNTCCCYFKTLGLSKLAWAVLIWCMRLHEGYYTICHVSAWCYWISWLMMNVWRYHEVPLLLCLNPENHMFCVTYCWLLAVWILPLPWLIASVGFHYLMVMNPAAVKPYPCPWKSFWMAVCCVWF